MGIFESSGKSMMSQLSYRMAGEQHQQSNVVSKAKKLAIVLREENGGKEKRLHLS